MKTVIIKNAGGNSKAIKITIGAILLLGAAIGGFVWLEHSKKEKKNLLSDPKKDSATPSSESQPTSTTSSSPSTSYTDTSSAPSKSTSSNPVNSTSSASYSVTKFQDWMDSKHPNWLNDGTNLNKDVKKGYGTAGKQTSKAYATYGSEYNAAISQTIQDLTNFLKANKDPLGKVVYSKYAGADVFDGNVLDTVFTKLAKTTKAQAMGKVVKVIPSATGFWVVFSGSAGKFYKMYASNLNILA